MKFRRAEPIFDEGPSIKESTNIRLNLFSLLLDVNQHATR